MTGLHWVTKIRKSLFYSRIRQYLPMLAWTITDDRARIDHAQDVLIDWPGQYTKPRVGIVQDYGPYPAWTRHARFLERNKFPYEIYAIQREDWLEKAGDFDVIVGVLSNTTFHLEEIRRKYYVLETLLKKSCFPSLQHVLLYEDKILEAQLAKIYGIPFVPTYVSHDEQDALRLIESLAYPVISKVNPSSSSVGVELIRTQAEARKIVRQAFSNNGRKIHVVYSRQKNYIYFQKFIPNDGYDLRVIVVGNRVFGYYRKAPEGDFRASGMHQEEKRSLPLEAMKIARKVNQAIKSPQLVVDMLHGQDGRYSINEYSPICQMSTLDQLQVDGVPGAYVFDDEDIVHFEPGSYWVHELALKEFFLNFYLPKISNGAMEVKENSLRDVALEQPIND